jgi:hypothetical protein
MRSNNMPRVDLLRAILPLEQEKLHDYLFMVLNDYYEADNIIEADGEYLFAKGNIPVLLCAHLDTVHKIKPIEEEIYFDQEKQVMWSPGGIGGDDRCGVFIILNLIFQGYKPHIAFTWNEEIGGVGARSLSLSLDPNRLDVPINFAIQLDRKGHQESVYYDLDSKPFENYINGFGFKTAIGTYTDICEICPEWGIAGVNLSAGYLHEHTSRELILLNTLEDTMNKVSQILEDQVANPKPFEYKELPKTYTNFLNNKGVVSTTNNNYYYEDYYYGHGYEDEDDYYDNGKYHCIYCGKPTKIENFCQYQGYEDFCIDCFYDAAPTKRNLLVEATKGLGGNRKHG